MRTYKTTFTEGMTVKFSKSIKEQIHQLATDANISQGEFVRDAVEHYINHLNKQNKQQTIELTEFDNVFNTKFFND